MTRTTVVRAVLAVLVLLASLFAVLTQSPRLGLDLQGGTRMVLETRDTAAAQADAATTDRTIEVLRQRIDALGVAEPVLARSGENRIVVELPDVQDPRRAAEVLGRTAQLAIHPVEEPPEEGTAEEGTAGRRVLPDEQGRPVALGAAALSGAGVQDAEARFDPQQGTGWHVALDFRGDAARDWAALTGRAACHPVGDDRRRVAIVLDDKVISSPQVDPSVGCGSGIASGATRITGAFDAAEARELALLIKGGALPVPVETVDQRIVGPTLGAAAISASAQAAAVGVSLTALFVTFVYRLFGALAAVALAAYGVISYAALVALGVTLTLPGLAGFVLAIGMAVDANVLVLERAREEYQNRSRRSPRSLRSTMSTASRKAWTAVADANATTLLAAGLLFLLGSGPVKGFGVTLAIGVAVSMFSALVVARALTDVAARFPFVDRFRTVSGVGAPGRVRTFLTRRRPRPMRTPRRWLTVSAVLVAVAVTGILVRGLNLGVEFTGGRLVEYATTRTVDADTARSAVAQAGFPDAEVTTADGRDVSVRGAGIDDDGVAAIGDALAGEGGGTATKLRDELIGPSMGEELRRNAMIALGIAVVAQLVYLTARFRWTFAAGCVVALVHDVVVVVGAFAWLGRPVDGVFLAALLTVVGYSVNDSVVVFDRVRELWRREPRGALPALADSAVLQTVPRTVNTGAGALFILAALAVLGDGALADFAIALIVGVCVGTYSSVLTAVPVALLLEAGRPAPAAAGRPRTGAPRRTARDNGAVV
ncbi:protein translocase subunit SecD [Streptomyces spongiicola]|uniref:Multifunctional fusion protein n=1 Tax=Streptomyces spongiicola TaxID=1690221 RepID=A0A388SSF9_9ACTN|nr:protein translocase subunit SecD [Streptomyces spongiicola]GBP99498.1 protein translocase subunit SecD [Streptomyces spongiicola]